MKKLSPKKKRFLTSKIIKKSKRRRLRKKRNNRKRKQKQQNYLQNAYERSVEHIKQKRKEITLVPKKELTLLRDTENVIEFISTLKSYKKTANEVKGVVINMTDVINIDIGTISLLLSSIKELVMHDIRVIGRVPFNSKANKVFQDSGFLDHMDEVSKLLKKPRKVSNKENLLLMLAKGKSESRKVGECIKLAIKSLTGTPSHYPAIYGIIQEMNGNSVEHAYRKNKHWILGINHDEENKKLIFTFTDNGFGIIKTLKRRYTKAIFDSLKLTSDETILKGIFNKEYNSRFKKQYNRNKGLPVIKKAQTENKIKNLIVISNNSFVDISNGTSHKLNYEFSGTFYYWELDLETYRYGKSIN